MTAEKSNFRKALSQGFGDSTWPIQSGRLGQTHGRSMSHKSLVYFQVTVTRGVKALRETVVEIITSGDVRLQLTGDALQVFLAEILKLDAVALNPYFNHICGR